MDKGKATRSSKKGKQEIGAALKGEINAAAGGALQQVAGGDHPAFATSQGIVISDNQNSLKVKPRCPALLEDFILREKITHFDHERIPVRVRCV